MAEATKLAAEVAGLYPALGTAKAGLKTAEEFLKAAGKTIDLNPIELDPELAGLYTALGTATATLQTAQEVLRTTVKVVGTLATVNTFILNQGLGSLLDVRSARFQTTLDVATGGTVLIDLNLVFMNQSQSMTFQFNFKSPLESAKALGRMLLVQ